MQTSDRVLSRRYAQAFFESAEAAGEGEKAAAALAEARAKLLSKLAHFRHPRVPAADKKALLAKELPGAPKRVLRFLELLVEKKRFGLLPMIAADAARISDERRGVIHASVRSAAPLSEQERKDLEARLGKRTGKTVVADVKEDPELLAGTVVRMGDWVFDASLKGQLRRLKARLAA